MGNVAEVTQLLLTRSAFRALEAEWNALAAGASPALQFDWLLSAVEELDPLQELRVVTVRREGVLVAAAALVEPRGLAPRLEWLGPQRGKTHDLLARDDAALETLQRALQRLYRPLVLRRIAAGQPGAAAFWARNWRTATLRWHAALFKDAAPRGSRSLNVVGGFSTQCASR